MNRNQLREDFEKAFPTESHKKVKTPAGQWYYKSELTRRMWLAWVSSFETYSNEQLTGEYFNDF